ncbi:MAG: hypothetical protein AAGB23_01000 [Pseudomonadota bacterium]
MKIRMAIAAAWAACVLTTSPTLAQSQAQSQDQSQIQSSTSRFACDTASGRFSEFKIPVNAARFTLSGSLTPALFRAHEQTTPNAIVGVQSSQTGEAMYIRASASSASAQGAMVTAELLREGQREAREIGTLAIGNVVGFAIIYVQGGQSRIVVGEQVVNVNADLGASYDLRLNCSTGDFVFDELVWQVGG